LTNVLKKEIISEDGEIYLNETEDRATRFDLNTFHLDAVEAIAKCLNVFDYLHFQATNRKFRRAARPLVDIEWRSIFDDRSNLPLFVLSYKDNVFTFVHPKQGLKEKYTINFPLQVNPDDEIICYSKDSWLLLALKHSSFFFNPFTKKCYYLHMSLMQPCLLTVLVFRILQLLLNVQLSSVLGRYHSLLSARVNGFLTFKIMPPINFLYTTEAQFFSTDHFIILALRGSWELCK
jgi:hypothetical protein